jgi:hypothetical protein
MRDSQIDKIKALEETARQLLQHATKIREEAESTNDVSVRETLLKAADECELVARNLADGLRRIRENLQ